MFHSRIDELNRDNLLESMGKPDSSVQVLIATIAYGMGIDCKCENCYSLWAFLQLRGIRARKWNSWKIKCPNVQVCHLVFKLNDEALFQ